MANFQYMVIGVTKAETGSMDAYFDVRIDNGNYDFAYLGCPTSSGPFPPPTWFTWNTGSLADPTQNDLQMFAGYPSTSPLRGKLYWVGTGSFETDYSGIPNNSGFVNLEIPPDGQYYIITPTLNDATFQSSGKFCIAQYAFVDEDDLWTNGWKSQIGSVGASNPLTTETKWMNVVGDNSWTAPPFNFDISGGTPGDKAQIVANVLALTNNSFTQQTAQTVSPRIQGAIVLAGKTTPFDNDTYRNLVPLKN
jgi:hypothetical protein